MSDQQLSAKIATILAQDRSLASMLVEEPRAMQIPFMKSTERFYLLTSLLFHDSPEILYKSRQLSLIALKLLVNSGIAGDLAGIELVPYLRTEDNVRRILRLSVVRESFDQALKLSEQDLLLQSPADGITCGWYVERPRE